MLQKIINSRWIVLMILLITFAFCTRSTGNKDNAELTESNNNCSDSLFDNLILEIPKRDTIVEKYEEEAIAKSPFKKYECCLDFERRKLKECCCVGVLNDYKFMYENADPKLGELVQKDPILSYCRGLMKLDYEAIKNELEGDAPLY